MSAAGGVLLEEKEEMDKQLREANNAVQSAEAQLRTLLSDLGHSSEEMWELFEAIKGNPSDFKEDPGRVKKALAEAMLQKTSIEIKITEQLRKQREAEALSARTVERSTRDAALFAKYVQQASEEEQVKLNVGGQLFTTSKSTMLAAEEGSLFDVLYSERQGTPPSPLFIDRDPAIFVYVLRFLRAVSEGETNIGQDTLMLPSDKTAAGVLTEARFLGLRQLESVLGEVAIDFGREKIRNVLENLQGPEAVVAVMKKHPDRAEVQEDGCYALECLARATGGNQVQIGISGGIEAVVDGMKNHPGSAKLQEYGCLALWHLAKNEANQGYWPLITECYKGLEGLAKRVLVEAGVKVDAPNTQERAHHGCTLLKKAVMEQKEHYVRLLVEAGADVNNQPPLCDAIIRQHEGLARMLVEAGADVNAKHGNSHTPLRYALEQQNVGLARMLVEAGADVNGAPHNFGRTKFLELVRGHPELEQLLRDKGAQ